MHSDVGSLRKLFIATAAALLLAAQCADASLTLSSDSDPATTVFGPMAVGSSESRTFTMKNGGSADAIFDPITLTPAPGSTAGAFALTGGTCVGVRRLAANGSCTLTLTYAPKATGTESVLLNVPFNWENSGVTGRALVRSFKGTAYDAVLLTDTSGNPLPIGAYGTRLIETSTGYRFILINHTLTDVVVETVSNEALGLRAPFSLSGGTCATGTRLSSNGGSCTVDVSFSPTEPGPYSQVFNMHYTRTNDGVTSPTFEIQLTGFALPFVNISDGPRFDYGPLSIGSTARKTFIVTNFLQEEVQLGTLSSAALGLSGPFSFAGGTCTAGVIRGSLPWPGPGTCTLIVAFAPTTLTSAVERFELPFRRAASGATGLVSRDIAGSGVVRDPVRPSAWADSTKRARCWRVATCAAGARARMAGSGTKAARTLGTMSSRRLRVTSASVKVPWISAWVAPRARS